MDALRWFWDVGFWLALSVLAVAALVGGVIGAKVSADARMFSWRKDWFGGIAVLALLANWGGGESRGEQISRWAILGAFAVAFVIIWFRRGQARRSRSDERP